MAEPRKDRRRSKRFRKRLRVRFWWGDTIEGTGYTKDVSATGMMIETMKIFELGQRLHLEIAIQDQAYLGECSVVRLKKMPPHARTMFKQGIGVRFIGLGEAINSVRESVEEHRPMEVDLSEIEDLEIVYERDIKHGGLTVRTSEEAALDSDVIVPVHLPAPHGTIQCFGTVVKLFDEGFAVNLRDIDPVRERIREILRENSRL